MPDIFGRLVQSGSAHRERGPCVTTGGDGSPLPFEVKNMDTVTLDDPVRVGFIFLSLLPSYVFFLVSGF